MKLVAHILLHLTLLAASVRAADIGLRADDGRTPQSTLGQINSRNLQRAMDKGTPVTFPPGDIYLARTATTPATVSCGRWDFTTAGGYSIEPTPQYGKVGTRIICKAGPVLRICGAGFVLNGPVEIIGDGQSAAIQIEGRSNPATGRHTFRDCVFRNWGCAFHCLAEPEEQHADNSKVYDCETANVECVFRSDNQQAVNWYFGGLVVNNLGGPTNQLVCDIRRGGLVTINGLTCCHPKVTIFKVRDYSPNTCGLTVNDLEFDNYPFPSKLTLLKYEGQGEKWMKWRVRATGFVCPNTRRIEGSVPEQWETLIDLSKWLDVPEKLPTAGIKWDVGNVEPPK